VLDSHDFTVEMETGTGKTYVYLRTMLELNKRYGMSKFIIVVPSVAIKEGVYKTLQITEHFKSLYAGFHTNTICMIQQNLRMFEILQPVLLCRSW
jgi:type III restriction enzyme